MKTSRVVGALLFLVVISLVVKLEAQEAPPATAYSGDFWQRSTLTGDWGGLRNELAARGVTLDMSLTQAAQGIVHGGKDTGWQYGGGRGDIILNLDTQKLGLWPGGFLNVEAEGNFTPGRYCSEIDQRQNRRAHVRQQQPDFSDYRRRQLQPPRFEFYSISVALLRLLDRQVRHYHLHLRRYERVCSWQRRHPVHEHGIELQSDDALTVPYSTLGTGLIVLPTKDPKRR